MICNSLINLAYLLFKVLLLLLKLLIIIYIIRVIYIYIYICTIDVSKAFDRVNLFVIFNLLRKRNFVLCI